jgi:hypothetical protein
MSGFSNDIISILKHNHMYEREAVGWLIESNISQTPTDLALALIKDGIPITVKDDKIVVNYDFIVLDKYHYQVGWLLTALTRTGTSGIIILEADRGQYGKHGNAHSLFGDFNVVSVKYEDRLYFVLRKGNDYGD